MKSLKNKETKVINIWRKFQAFRENCRDTKYMLTHIPGRSRETEFSANVGALISGVASALPSEGRWRNCGNISGSTIIADRWINKISINVPNNFKR